MRSDVNFQISHAGLSHPARVLTNQMSTFKVPVQDCLILHGIDQSDCVFHCSYYIILYTNSIVLNNDN